MMSFHNRFGTKENFFAAIMLRHAKETFVNVERGRPGFPRQGISLREELLLFTALLLAHCRAERKLMGAILRYPGSSPIVREGMTISNHAIKKQFRWHMAPHHGAITHPDPEVALRLAVELPTNLALQMFVLDPGPIRLDDPDLAPNVADAMHRILAGRLAP